MGEGEPSGGEGDAKFTWDRKKEGEQPSESLEEAYRSGKRFQEGAPKESLEEAHRRGKRLEGGEEKPEGKGFQWPEGPGFDEARKAHETLERNLKKGRFKPPEKM